jgi:uncharacterized protein YnzC (UPF0291/DUF896 family)
MEKRQMSLAAQSKRATELEAIGKERLLTKEELAEYDNLAHRSYMRHWRQQQEERWQPNKFNAARRTYQ